MSKNRLKQYFVLISQVSILFLISRNVIAADRNCPLSCQDAQDCAFKVTQSNHYIKYFATQSVERPNSCVTTAVIYVHGTSRNAESYFESAITAAKLENRLADTIIISPSYKTLEDLPGADELYWTNGGWKQGHKSVNPLARISSFEIIDGLVESLANRRKFPNLRNLVIVGHSAGGQFTQRYAFSSTIDYYLPGRISLKYVVMNPSSYVYPNSYRPHPLFPRQFVIPYRIENARRVMKEEFLVSAGSCPYSYNEYKYGLDAPNAYLNRTDIYELIASYPFKNLYYLAGTTDNEDVNEMDSSCEAMTQGPHRYARAEAFFDSMNQFFPYNIHQFVAVPGVGHSGSQMIRSEEARNILWSNPNRKEQKD